MWCATKSCWHLSVDSPVQVFVTGDSHTGALKRGLMQLERLQRVPAGFQVQVQGMGSGAHMIRPFFRDLGDCAQITEPTFQDHVTQLPLPTPDGLQTVYCWSGLFHFAKVWRDKTWATHRPATIDGVHPPVSTGMLRETILEWFRYQLAVLEVLKRNGCRVLAVESPRPFRHHPALASNPAEVVAAVDRICQDVMLGELQARSIPLVRIPQDWVDDEGFMQPEWRHEKETDPHHASARFGALMIRRICEQLIDDEARTNG
jgi:hypothetical protein